MKLFRRYDAYLLTRFPLIWETRVHIFLPLGLVIALLLFLIPVLSEWSFDDNLPLSNSLWMLMLAIPMFIWFAYWFVLQSRYNAVKSGIKISLPGEYLTFGCYVLVFFTAFLMLNAIPFGNYQKVRNAVVLENVQQDVTKLNYGNTLVNGMGDVLFDSTGTITFSTSAFIRTSFYDAQQAPEDTFITVTHDGALTIIREYIEVFNRYTSNEIIQTPEELLIQRNKEFLDSINSGNYRMTTEFKDFPPIYAEDYFYGRGDNVESKLWWIAKGYEESWYFEYANPPFLKLNLVILIYLSLLVWIFKQMPLRQFIIGVIALSLTLPFLELLNFLLVEVVHIRLRNIVTYTYAIILIIYLLIMVLTLWAYSFKKLRKAGFVLTMYLQFILPWLPAFLHRTFLYNPETTSYEERVIIVNFLFWICFLVGVVSIVIFKPLYTKFRSLPENS